MKKIFLFILPFLIAFGAKAQYPITQNIGSDSTLLNSKGATKSRIINFLFTDTTQANTQHIKQYPFAQIVTNVGLLWIRDVTATRWILIGSGFSPNPTCGLMQNTGIVTWDSLLVFDVSPAIYALCCDNVPRSTNATLVTLPPADPDNPRIDAIVLKSTGVAIDTGIAQANPALPQLDSCQILLTYVLINAGQTTPAFITSSNPNIIYDENYHPGEWTLDTTSQVTIDTADIAAPVHLTHDIAVTGITVGGFFEFITDSTINLNDYGAFKFYVRERDNSSLQLLITWYLDDVPQTAAVQAPIASGLSGQYQTIVISTASWRFIGTSTAVNKIRITVLASGSSGFYLDWLQLQTGIPAPASPLGITSVSGGNLSPLFNMQVSNPTGPQVALSFIQQSANAYTVLGRFTNTAGAYSFGTIDLSTPITTGLLDVSRLNPNGSDGDYVGQSGGVVQFLPFENDTTFTHNGIYRSVDPLSNNDTLAFGYFKRDSSFLAYTTYVGINSKILDFTQGTANVFQLSSLATNAGLVAIGSSRFEQAYGTATAAANNLTLPNDGNAISITGNTQINAITTANWQSGSQVELIFTGTPTVKNNTAWGAGTATILLAGSVDFTAAANDVLSLVYDGTNWHESARKTASGAGTQTLQQTFNTEVGGSILTKRDTILTGANYIRMIGTGSAGVLNIDLTGGLGGGISVVTDGGNGINATVTGGGTGVNGSSTTSVGVEGQSGSLIGVWGLSTSGPGVQGNSSSGVTFRGFRSSALTNTVGIAQQLVIGSSGTVADGFGESFDFNLQTANGSEQTANKFISKWVTAANATRTSQAIITVVYQGTTNNLIYLTGENNSAGGTLSMGTATPSSSYLVDIEATGSTFGILANTVNSAAIQGVSVNGSGIDAISTSQPALTAATTSGTWAAQLFTNPSSTNTIVSSLFLQRSTSSTAAIGIGTSIEYYLEASDGSINLSNQLISKSTNVTVGTRATQFIVTGVDNAVTNTLLTLSGSGAAQLNKYGIGTFTGTPAYTLQVDASGNIIEGSAGGGGWGTTGTIATLTGDATVDLNGKVLHFNMPAGDFLTLDPTPGSEAVNLSSYNNTGGGNQAGFSTLSENSDASFSLTAGFNSFAKQVSINGSVDVSSATLTYIADTHTFTGEVDITGRTKIYGNGDFNGADITLDFLGTSSNVITIGPQSSNYGYFLYKNSGTTQQWGQGLYGSSDWTLRDVTNSVDALVVKTTDIVQMAHYGAGGATFDASGNISSVSDERLKNIQGYYSGGLKELMNINPISYKWNEKSGMEMQHDYIGFSAQNIQSALGDNAIGINSQGYLSIQDRAVMATLVNAIKEQQYEIERLQKLVLKR